MWYTYICLFIKVLQRVKPIYVLFKLFFNCKKSQKKSIY